MVGKSDNTSHLQLYMLFVDLTLLSMLVHPHMCISGERHLDEIYRTIVVISSDFSVDLWTAHQIAARLVPKKDLFRRQTKKQYLLAVQ